MRYVEMTAISRALAGRSRVLFLEPAGAEVEYEARARRAAPVALRARGECLSPPPMMMRAGAVNTAVTHQFH